MSEHAPEHGGQHGREVKHAGLTRQQWYIVGGIALVGVAYLLYKRHQASTAAAATTTAAGSSSNLGAGTGTCPDGSSVDCGGLCADGSTPVGCDQSGQLSTLQTELGNLQSSLAQGGGGGGGVTTVPVTSTPPATTPPAPNTPAPAAGGSPAPSGGGSWSYPAPTGLRASSVAKNGYYLNWNPVTGPQGQKPSSYTIATYDSKGQRVNQHTTVGPNTQTAEYGPGGKGLPKGTYHSNVWANGGPKAPPHATVQVTLTG